MRALTERDSQLGEPVSGQAREANRLEIEIDEPCRRLLVLRQPAASDLRLITTALKIVVDLERIGDLAVNIAERAIDLNQSPPLKPIPDLSRLADLGQRQVRGALDAFVEADPDKGEQVIKDDDLLDSLYHNLVNELLALMMEDPRNIRRANSLLFVAKHLERIGDHATNVAEMVIYMVRGTTSAIRAAAFSGNDAGSRSCPRPGGACTPTRERRGGFLKTPWRPSRPPPN